MADISKSSIEVGVEVGIEILKETVNRCLVLLEMYLRDHPGEEVVTCGYGEDVNLMLRDRHCDLPEW